MKFASKFVGLCLVVALIGALVPAMLVTDATAAADRAPGPAESAASCHTHGGSQHGDSHRSDLPVPLSYRCCITGHDAAVVQVSQSPQPLAQCGRVASRIEPGLIESAIRRVEGSIALSADPPSTAPLRI